MFKSRNKGKNNKTSATPRFNNTPKDNEHEIKGYRDSSNNLLRSDTSPAKSESSLQSISSPIDVSSSPEPPPPADIPPPTAMDETEAILLKLHSSLIDFYTKHKPENVDEDVLTILMQFFIDAGGVALNKKLMDKYGEDLNTFTPTTMIDEEPPPPPDSYSARTMERVKRRSLEAEYDITLPPPPKFEAAPPSNPIGPSKSKNAKTGKKKKKKPQDSELEDFKNAKNQEGKALEAEIDKDLFGDDHNIEEREDPSLRLDVLDRPNDQELTARDLIEAFYAKHDESKLEKDTGIEKFVMWVEQHSLEGLSDKLKAKYKEGLMEQKKLARRRRNLEDHLTNFYLKHDRAKLETRWTIMKILNWTMIHGVVALNKKFITRYGLPVVPL